MILLCFPTYNYSLSNSVSVLYMESLDTWHISLFQSVMKTNYHCLIYIIKLTQVLYLSQRHDMGVTFSLYSPLGFKSAIYHYFISTHIVYKLLCNLQYDVGQLLRFNCSIIIIIACPYSNTFSVVFTQWMSYCTHFSL